jgi:cell division protein FtsQ
VSTPATAAGKRRARARATGARSIGSPPAGRSGQRRGNPTGSRSAPRAAGRRQAKGPSPIRWNLAAWRGRLSALPAAARSSTWRRRGILVAALAAILLLTYFGWFRNSSLVAVSDVQVQGAGGPDRERIVAALTRAARDMTTLHVESGALRDAVADFPTVASVSADPSFPHGLTIQVSERPPMLIAGQGDNQVSVAGDGWLLPGVEGKDGLPRLAVDSLPSSGRLSGEPLSEARAVGAAPDALRPLIEGVAYSGDYGVVLTMRGGIELRFGGGGSLDRKWAAVATTLADPQLMSLSYVDVRVPERPAVGGDTG